MNLKYWGLLLCVAVLFIFGLRNSFLKKRIASLLAKEEKQEQAKRKEKLATAIAPLQIEIAKSKKEKHITKKDYRILQVQEEELREKLKVAQERYKKAHIKERRLNGELAHEGKK